MTRLMFSEDAEQATIAALLIGRAAFDVVLPFLQPSDFYARRHVVLFGAMLVIHGRGEVCDPITLAEELTRRGELDAAGGKDYLGFLVDAVPTAANVEYHARIVVEHAQRRAIVERLERDITAIRDHSIEPAAAASQLRVMCDGFLSAVEGTRLGQALRAIDAPPPERIKWAIEDLWPAGEIGLLVGDGGSFKSTVAVHVAGAMAGGYAVFNRFRTTQGPSLIVSAEDPASVVLMRLQAFARGHGWNERTVGERVHIIADPSASLGDPRWQQHIAREASRVGAALIVLDPLADLLDGDENSNSELRPIVKYLRGLGRDTGAAVGVVHHAGKASAERRSLDRIRGASALASAARTILFFEYGDSGVAVEHLKMSRAPKLEKFMVQRTIDSNPDNRAVWVSAHLGYEKASDAALSRGEAFVMAQVTASPRQLTTADLRRATEGVAGIRYDDIARALTSLQARGAIDFEPAPRNAKLWFPTLPTSLGRVA